MLLVRLCSSAAEHVLKWMRQTLQSPLWDSVISDELLPLGIVLLEHRNEQCVCTENGNVCIVMKPRIFLKSALYKLSSIFLMASKGQEETLVLSLAG